MKKIFLYAAIAAFTAVSCTTVPVTGRKQLILVSSGEMVSLGAQNYKETIGQSKLSKNAAQSQKIKTIGKKIQNAVETYMAANGLSSQLDGFEWEFNLIDNDTTVNAWCMPGGKVAFYTGILPICQDDNGIAIVMGHEIAHAVANHSAERMSQAMLLELGGQLGGAVLAGQSDKTQKAFQSLYSVGSQVGVLLPYSRDNEYEADRMGMIFMAMAGYDPQTAVGFWERMAAKGGSSTPQFLSTHPTDANRIAKIKEAMPEALKYYKKK